jgi:hypothetical protein
MREVVLALLLLGAPFAAGAATDGVYHPYVNQGERELEYGLAWRGIGDDAVTLQRASFGHAPTDDVAVELYVVSDAPGDDGSRARAAELEVRWQLTEQGEYASDWGLLFEAETGYDGGHREVAAGVLWEKELGNRWVAAANGIVEYEFGAAVDNEFETAFRGQLRRLVRPTLEPALEVYLDDEDYAAGPALLGARRLGVGRIVRWELGLLFGLDAKTPARTLRASLEFEF